MLRELRLGHLRVRDYDNIARIEVSRKDLGLLLNGKICGKVTEKFKSLGYKYVTLDMVGYCSEFMDAAPPKAQ